MSDPIQVPSDSPLSVVIGEAQIVFDLVESEYRLAGPFDKCRPTKVTYSDYWKDPVRGGAKRTLSNIPCNVRKDYLFLTVYQSEDCSQHTSFRVFSGTDAHEAKYDVFLDDHLYGDHTWKLISAEIVNPV